MRLGIKELVVLMMLVVLPGEGMGAPVIPSSADISKVPAVREERGFEDGKVVLPEIERERKGEESGEEEAPAGSEKIKIKLVELRVEGSTIYTDEELRGLYGEYMGKEITLDKVWVIAGRVTKRYQSDGYFLSKAYVPKQEMEHDASIVIKVFEGRIGEVNIDEELLKRSYIKKIIEDIRTESPVNIRTLEKSILRLNDIPGVQLRTVLQKGEGDHVRLDLVAVKEAKRSVIRYDNSGSRFLGPNKISYTHEGTYLPYVSSALTLSSSVPYGEITSAALSNSTVLNADTYLEVNGTASHAEPGYTVAPQEVISNSTSLEINIDKKLIRSRDRNFDIRLGYELADTETNVFKDTRLSKDSIRAIELSLQYSDINGMLGSENFDFSIKQGLDAFGATRADSPDSSRSHTVPDFLKFELKSNIQRNIMDNKYAIIAGVNGQYSDDSLYSGEEFGYGGPSLGRAYDNGEISGDKGIAGWLEVDYLKAGSFRNMTPVPYIFYDAGKVWNNNPGQEEQMTAESYGIGMKAYYRNLTANVFVALPSQRKISTPAFGNKDNYRTGVSVQYNY